MPPESRDTEDNEGKHEGQKAERGDEKERFCNAHRKVSLDVVKHENSGKHQLREKEKPEKSPNHFKVHFWERARQAEFREFLIRHVLGHFASLSGRKV